MQAETLSVLLTSMSLVSHTEPVANKPVTERWATIELMGLHGLRLLSVPQEGSPCLWVPLLPCVTPFLPGPLPAPEVLFCFPLSQNQNPHSLEAFPRSSSFVNVTTVTELLILASEMVKKASSEVPMLDFKCVGLAVA